MIFPGLKNWAARQGWSQDKNVIYGYYNDYLFTAGDGQGFKFFAVSVPKIDSASQEQVLARLMIRRKELKIANLDFQDHILTVQVAEKFKSMGIQDIEAVLKEMAGALAEAGAVQNSCQDCGVETQDKVLINHTAIHFCPSCYDSLSQNIDAALQEFETEDKNYFQGFMGAILGAVVGAIPWVLVEAFTGVIAAFLGALIGLAAYKGYQLFQGKVGPATRWLIILATIFGLVFAQASVLVIFIIQLEIPLTMENIAIILAAPGLLRELGGSFLFSLLMAGLGVSSLFSRLGSEAKPLPQIQKLS